MITTNLSEIAAGVVSDYMQVSLDSARILRQYKIADSMHGFTVTADCLQGFYCDVVIDVSNGKAYLQCYKPEKVETIDISEGAGSYAQSL